MSSTTYAKFRSIGDPRRLESSSNRLLLPVLVLTSPVPGKSIHIPINPLSIWMHIRHHVVFPDVGYVLPEGILQGSSRCHQERARHTNCCWMNLPCLGLPISHSSDYQPHPSCVLNVPCYGGYLCSNHFLIHVFDHQEPPDLSQAICGQYRAYEKHRDDALNVSYLMLAMMSP
jgi:hypothetical protein